LRFLEADPWCFRSGYVKADLVRAAIRLDLTEAEKDRLRRVVLLVVDDPVLRRELRPYARLAVAVAGPGLVEGLEARSSVESPVIRSNARWILDALAGRQLPRMSRIASARFRRPS
jgi:NAD(P)H-hydrate repair Nnr-like enzyme with NAD(P)H-hydrate dehydratase domain